MKKIISYYMIVTVFFLVACKKDKPGAVTNPPPTIKLNAAALEFVQLPVGRYFIYKDSATGFTDSVRVTQSIFETLFHPGKAGTNCGILCFDPGEAAFYFEKFSLTISSTSQEWFKGIASTDNYYPSYYFNLLGNPAVVIDTNFFLADAFWYPLQSSGVNLYTFLPSLIIEGHTYTGIHQFSASNGLPVSDANYKGTTFYWVKGIGIIKKEIRTYNSIKTSLLVRHG